MSARALVVAAALVACGGSQRATITATAPSAQTTAERMIALLPDGAQIIVELDLARLRANAAVGAIAQQALGQLGADAHIPGLPLAVLGSPLATSDVVVLAAYGVGTAQAATVTVLATKTEIEGATRLAPDLVALGPDEWTGQLASRAAIAQQTAKPLAVSRELLDLRARAMPKGATGAVVRITARLTFDARIALARLTGVDAAPAQMSLWGDVADDIAIVLDADSADPGSKGARDSARRLAATLRKTIAALADVPVIRGLGVTTSLGDARLVAQGSWVRAVVAVGPRHLARVVERARAMLDAPPPAPPP